MQGPDASVQRIPGNRAAFSKTLAKCSGGEQKLEISISFELAEDDEGPTIDAQSICILTVIKKKKNQFHTVRNLVKQRSYGLS